MQTLSKNTIPYNQLVAAHRLAAEYNHMWGACNSFFWGDNDTLVFGNQVNKDANEVTLEGIVEITKLSDYFEHHTFPGKNAIGILAPELNENGNVFHRTGTGRVTWEVDKTGSANIKVNRKDGVVIEMEFSNQAELLDLDELKIIIHAPYYTRHVGAAFEATCALLGKYRAFAIVAPLWAGAMDAA